MIKIDNTLDPKSLRGPLQELWTLSAMKIRSIAAALQPGSPTPVYTVRGKYTSRGWTEWTQGFLFGSAILQFDATGDKWFLDYGLDSTLRLMAPHVTHFGVHDHGFNNVSTYGNLLRLMDEGRIPGGKWEREFLAMAIKCSAAIQARRWTALSPAAGFIHSFNGPHSLFADTIRTLRVLALAHQLGHRVMGENDVEIPLLARLVSHARATTAHNVYYGEGRDAYDVRGRVAHEAIFNVTDGRFRCPNSQQGYSPFSTWTRGLSWILLGCAEQLEFLESLPDSDLAPLGGRADIEGFLLRAAEATADFYIENTPADGIPYWDTGAPGLHKLGDYLSRPADPNNDFEPVDSSAAAICAQGYLRLAGVLVRKGRQADGARMGQAGLTILRTLLAPPYISESPDHQGLLLHSVYHRPNGWDYIPPGAKVPRGESSMWGDYHLMEAALMVWREIEGLPRPAFFLRK